MRQSIGDLRGRLRTEHALLIVPLVVAVIAAFLFLRLDDVQGEDGALAEQIVKTRAAIDSSKTEAAALQRQIEEQRDADGGEAAVGVQTLPSRGDALDLGTRLTSYAGETNLDLNSFDFARTPASIAAVEYPAVTYNLVATGPSGPLIGMLAIVREAPTVLVQTLEMTREPDSQDTWTMSLDLVIMYQ